MQIRYPEPTFEVAQWRVDSAVIVVFIGPDPAPARKKGRLWPQCDGSLKMIPDGRPLKERIKEGLGALLILLIMGAVAIFWIELEYYITELGSRLAAIATVVGLSYAFFRYTTRNDPPPLTTEQLIKLRRERPGFMDDAGRMG